MAAAFGRGERRSRGVRLLAKVVMPMEEYSNKAAVVEGNEIYIEII